MTGIYCLLNHELTSKQKEELFPEYGANNIIYPPAAVSALWAGIPTDKELTKVHFEPFTAWLRDAKPGDVLILQGEFGATFALTDFALQKGLIPVCAVSKRVSREIREGEVVRKTNDFEHICFRRYRYYGDLT